MMESNTAVRHLLLIFLLSFSGGASAGQQRSIDLRDGSVVVGEIVTAGNGIYSVKTETLGVISLKEADILAIRSRESAPRQGSSADLPPVSQGEGLQAMRQRIMSDTTLMQSVNALKDDPEIQKILQDPALMKAIQDGNLDALKDSPKIQSLMNNPTLQGIYRTLGR